MLRLSSTFIKKGRKMEKVKSFDCVEQVKNQFKGMVVFKDRNEKPICVGDRIKFEYSQQGPDWIWETLELEGNVVFDEEVAAFAAEVGEKYYLFMNMRVGSVEKIN